jgi:hypothetical protein
MGLPQITIRRMMVAIALVAVILAAWIERIEMKRRSVEYELRAFRHGLDGYPYKYGTLPYTRVHLNSDRPPPAPDSRKAAYHDAMSSKWSEAALRPWLPVEPDPPEPE